MSVRVRKDTLSIEQINKIRQYLCFQPKSSFSFQSYTNTNTKDPILFYSIEGEDIIIPYTFYRVLTNRQPNADIKYPIVNYNFTQKLLDRQTSAVTECLEQLTTTGTTLLAAYPAFGKTVVGAYLTSKLNVIPLIIYHREILQPQWYSTFKDFTDAKIWVVGQPRPDEANVILCMDTQFKHIPPHILSMIGCLVIDEAHAFCTPGHIDCWLKVQPKYVITLTATPDRDDGMHSIREAVCGMHGVYRLSTKPFTVIRFLTGIKPILNKNSQGTLDWADLTKQLCTNELRNSYILSLIQSNPDFKILVLTWSQSHAFLLHKWLQEMNISAAVMAGNLHTYSDSRVLVGTISKIGTGFDEKAACENFGGERINLLILVGSTKSEKVIEQTVGRVFRSESPYVICFVDDVPTIKRHWGIFKKWALFRNATIEDMNMKKLSPPSPTNNSTNNSTFQNLAKSQLSKLLS